MEGDGWFIALFYEIYLVSLVDLVFLVDLELWGQACGIAISISSLSSIYFIWFVESIELISFHPRGAEGFRTKGNKVQTSN